MPRKQSSQKIYTDILENTTQMLNKHRDSLVANKITVSEKKLKKVFFEKFSIVSYSTYSKYLRELENGTYIPCLREDS